MDGQTVLTVVFVAAVLIWLGQLLWLFRMAESQRLDPFRTVSGAAFFFVLAAPVAMGSPALVDRMGGFVEKVVAKLAPGSEPAAVEQAVPARLLVSGEQRAISGPRIRLGRYPNNEIVLDHTTVSAYHAEIVQRPDGRHEIVDNESRNGTRVNGALVTNQVLRDGDLITLGAASIHYLSSSSSGSQAAFSNAYRENRPRPAVDDEYYDAR
ncbi:MAG TPA: FHA domain-containing protein [Thermomicrobiales bacterium]|nr:FHA domain-containing protein [Thermomicrobiales bacterium]